MNSLWFHQLVVIRLVQILLFNTPGRELPDNTLSREEQEASWMLLFNGKTLDGWQTTSGKRSNVPVEGEAINPHQAQATQIIIISQFAI